MTQKLLATGNGTVQAAGSFYRTRHSEQDPSLAALDPFVRQVLRYGLEQRARTRWHLTFEVDSLALQQLWSQRLGRTVLLTNRMDWTARTGRCPVIPASNRSERVFRGLKDGDWLGWGLRCTTGPTVRFACMLSTACWESRCFIYVHRRIVPERLARDLTDGNNCTGATLLRCSSSLCCILRLATRGPNRVATVLSKQTLAQQALRSIPCRLDELCSTQRR